MLEKELLLFDPLLHRALLPEFTRDASHAKRAEHLLSKPLRILDDALARKAHLAGEAFTVADLNVAGVLAWGKMEKLDRCLARPAYARVRSRTGRTQLPRLCHAVLDPEDKPAGEIPFRLQTRLRSSSQKAALRLRRLLAGTERSQRTPTAAVGRPGPRVERQLPGATAN